MAEVDDLLQMGSPVARIVDYDRLEVSVDVDEYDTDALEIGKSGDVYIKALDTVVPGVVSDIAREAMSLGGVSFYPVKLQLVGDANIRSGMSVEVRVLKEKAEQAACIHLNAISYDAYNKPFVLVSRDGRSTDRRYIITGISDGVYAQVLSGLTEGETVYYQPSNTLRFFNMSQQNGQMSTQMSMP